MKIGLRVVFALTLIALLWLTLTKTFELVHCQTPDCGQDFRVYCAAAATQNEGLNPYYVNDLRQHSNSDFSFVYPPLTLPVFNGFCKLSQPLSYMVVWALLLLGSVLVVYFFRPGAGLAFITGLVLTGFQSAYANFRLGNVGLVQLFVWAAIFALISRNRWLPVAVLLGLLGWVKPHTLAFGLLFLFMPWPRSKSYRFLCVMLAVFAVLHLASFMYSPALEKTYWLAISGQLLQHSPIREVNCPECLNKGPVIAIPDAISLALQLPLAVRVIIIFAFEALFLGLWFVAVTKIKKYAGEPASLLFAIGMLAITLLSPRVPVYELIILTPALVVLFQGRSLVHRTLVLVLTCVLPLLLEFTENVGPLLTAVVNAMIVLAIFGLILIRFSKSTLNNELKYG
jgi:hypothetical protein